jgi:fermentation-respiration switch protein FrsA (DUF1100 family)
LTYLGICIVLLALENWFLFKGIKAADGWAEPPTEAMMEDVQFNSSDGNTLHAWWTTPDGWTPDQGAILYSHGNYGNLSQRGRTIAYYRSRGYAVLIYDYPGYGRSTGQPSEPGLYAAGEAAYRWLVDEKKVPGERILLYGGSLGGTVATELATRFPCRALILAAAFTSFPDMAQRSFPFLPARYFVRNQMNNLAKIATLKCPVFLTHGTADRVIPHEMSERLYAAAPQPKEFLSVPDKDHNDAVGLEFFEHLEAFLKKHAP